MESSAAATAFPIASCSGIGGAGGRAGWEADAFAIAGAVALAATAFGVVGWALLLFELLGIPEVVVSGDRNTNREEENQALADCCNRQSPHLLLSEVSAGAGGSSSAGISQPVAATTRPSRERKWAK